MAEDNSPSPPAINIPNAPPVFVVDAEDIQNFRPPLTEEIEAVPVAVFVDSKGKVHFEINYVAYRLTKRGNFWRWLFHPQIFYRELCDNMIAGCLLKDVRSIIGGGQGSYYHKKKIFNMDNGGGLPFERLPPEVAPFRRQSFENLMIALEQFVLWLGGREITSWSVLSKRKMTSVGWTYQGRGTLKEFIMRYIRAFPLTLVPARKYSRICGSSNLRQSP